MPTTLVVLVLAITAFASTAGPLEAQTFEGAITYQLIQVNLDALAQRGYDVTEALFDVPVDEILASRDSLAEGGPVAVDSIEFLVKGHQVWMAGGGSGSLAINLQSGLTRLIQPDLGTYVEITHADQVEMLEIDDGTRVEPPEVAQTGRSRTINGMTATAFDVTSLGRSSRIWASRDSAELVSVIQQLAERMYLLAEENRTGLWAAAEYGIPVLFQALESGRYSIGRLISVERRAISADLFEPPAGLRRVTVPEVQEMMREVARDALTGSGGAPP